MLAVCPLHKPVQQAGSPIRQVDAISKCAALGAGYHLINNPEWITLATNLARISSNWSGGAVGSGALRRGHGDNDPPNTCAANASDANAYVATDCMRLSTGTFVERRTSILSNGSVIWDIGGNLWNWVNYVNIHDKPTPALAAWTEYTAITASASTPRSHLLPQNSVQSWWNDSWTSTQGIGQIYPHTNGTNGAMSRGAIWSTGTGRVGAFAMTLDRNPWSTATSVGFRCAYTQNTLAVTYEYNGGTGGAPPNDPALYTSGNIVTVKGNTVNMLRGNYIFTGWNTAADGSGTGYTAGQTFSISANTILYAQWTNCTGLTASSFWQAVPGNSIYGTNDFCLQKYAASNSGGVPISTHTNAPWVNISQTTAISTCASLGANFHLVTNPEWMTVAANLANVASNWSGAAVGSGTLRRGHSDGSPFNICAANANDDNAYVETDCTGTSTGTFTERRTSTLSNNTVFWDIGGNAWNWVNYNNSADKPTPASASYFEFTAITGSSMTPMTHLIPLNSAQSWWTDSWTSTQGIGQINPGTNGSGGALRRGALWYSGANAGAFSVGLDYDESTTSSEIGFRCSYQP